MAQEILKEMGIELGWKYNLLSSSLVSKEFNEKKDRHELVFRIPNKDELILLIMDFVIQSYPRTTLLTIEFEDENNVFEYIVKSRDIKFVRQGKFPNAKEWYIKKRQ